MKDPRDASRVVDLSLQAPGVFEEARRAETKAAQS